MSHGHRQLSHTRLVDVFKSLGCKMSVLTASEREQLGMSATDAQKQQRAVLKAPVVYPRIKRRAAQR